MKKKLLKKLFLREKLIVFGATICVIFLSKKVFNQRICIFGNKKNSFSVFYYIRSIEYTLLNQEVMTFNQTI